MPSFGKFLLRQLEHSFAVSCTHGQKTMYIKHEPTIDTVEGYNGITLEVCATSHAS